VVFSPVFSHKSLKLKTNIVVVSFVIPSKFQKPIFPHRGVSNDILSIDSILGEYFEEASNQDQLSS
jgi:hypothetical protein